MAAGGGVALSLLSGSDGARSQPIPVGEEFRVNTYTPGIQSEAKVAMDADGDFVIVWESIAQDDA